MNADDRVLSRFRLVALWYPAALTLLAVALQLVALPHVPDPVAVHWGADGVANGFAPAWTSILLAALVGIGLPAVIAATSLPGLRRGNRGPSYRFLGAIAAATSTLLGVLTTWTLLMQAGLPESGDAPAVWAPLTAGYVAAIAAGLAAWSVQPRQTRPEPGRGESTPLPLAADERAVWMREASVAPIGGIVLGLAVVLVGGAAVAAWLVTDDAAGAWLPTAVAVLLAGLAATTVSFRVRVDQDGLHVVSIAGVPRFRVPLADVAAVRVVEVDPMGEYGGWGLRHSLGRGFGVVLRRGQGIEVERRDGRRFTVTVDDAATGAALLQALARRAPERAGSADAPASGDAPPSASGPSAPRSGRGGGDDAR